MSVVICPGMNDAGLTQSFLANAGITPQDCLIFPTDCYPAYSTVHLLNYLRHQFSNPLHANRSLTSVTHIPLTFLAFSAGVVAALGAAWVWRALGGQVSALIALDGWGVPLVGDFPIYRLSHDRFTHWSSALLGMGQESFYAEPAVPHLELWRSPHTTQGYHVGSPVLPMLDGQMAMTRTTAAEFVRLLLTRHREQSHNAVED